MHNPSAPQFDRDNRRRTLVHAAVVAAGFSAIFIWVYWRAIVGRVYLAQSDLYEYFLPIFLSPRITWSTFEFSGIPVFADPGESTAYPVHVLFAKVLGSWGGFAAAAHVIGALAMYAYVYSLTRSKTSSALSGLAFGLSEVMMERLAHMATLHTIAWTPLVFLAVERVLATGRRLWVGLGSLIVAMVILSGHPQPALYACYAASAYALVGGWMEGKGRRYYVDIVVMFLLGGLLASIKLIPFAESLQYMARDRINFGAFTSLQQTPALMWTALFPTVLHDGRETPTYVGLLMVVFAIVGATRARSEWRARFWIAAVLFCVLIAMGDATPVARIAYDYLPTYNRFRVGGRHLIIACLGTIVLAGLGIDAVQRGGATRRLVGSLAAVVVLMAGGLAYFHGPHAGVAFEAREATAWSRFGVPPIVPDHVWTQVAIAAATIAVCVAFGRARRTAPSAVLMLIVLAVDLLNAQPFAVSMRGVNGVVVPASASRPSVHVGRIMEDLAPTHQRFLAIGGTTNDVLIPATWARLWRVPIAGGYGPMLLDRHSQLSTMGRNGSVRASTLALSDQSLNLLAVKYIGVQPGDVRSQGTFQSGGIAWEKGAIDLAVGRDDCNQAYDKTLSIPLPADAEIAAVDLVVYLRCAESTSQGSTVATTTLVGTNGRTYDQVLRAGIDVSEMGLSDPSLAARALHRAVGTFSDSDSGTQLRSRVTLRPPAPTHLSRLDVHVPPLAGWLVIARMTVIDAAGGQRPQAAPASFLGDARRWRMVRTFRTTRTTDRGRDEDRDDEVPYTVYENLKPLPRAWIATHIETMDTKDVLPTIRYSQLPDGRPFDPATTVLLEKSLPVPTATSFSDAGSVRIGLEDNGRWELDVATQGGGMLVLGETSYPGWKATIDGTPAPIYTADLSLMGIAVPPGSHRVTFTFAPFTLRVGAAMSIVGCAVALVLIAVPTRQRSDNH